MLFRNFFRQQPGQPIKADTINMPLDAIEDALKTSYASPLEATTAGGVTTVGMQSDEPLWISLTSGTGTGPYSWTDQIPQSGGTWIDGYEDDASGADPAYNTINATPILPIIVEARRNAAGILSFSCGNC